MNGPATSALRVDAERHLRALAGAGATLRDDQWTAIDALVRRRRRALVVQRTGWGKSAVYFVATALLRASGGGPTVLISPLLALMRDQIASARRAGITAVTVNSTNVEAWEEIYGSIAAGTVDVVLLSPERINNPDFRDRVLPTLAATCGLLVVDEAHCISDWGHDFRPDFRRLRALLVALPEGTPVLATTATANSRVVADVESVLGLRTDSPTSAEGSDHNDSVLVLRGSLERDSLHLGVVSLPDDVARLAWLADHLATLPGSGIIYTLTVAATVTVSTFLRSQGYDVAAYSGNTDPADREQAENDLRNNRVKALVATSALGMGYDKPDLGFIVNYGAPASPVAYYQQIGRAGRAVASATVVLLPGQEDAAIWQYFGSAAMPRKDQAERVLAALASEVRSTQALEASVEVSRSRLELLLKILDVDGAVRRVRGGWQSTGVPWRYDEERYAAVAATRISEQRAMRDYLTLAPGACRMAFLRRHLDDPLASACGRCDTCGTLKLPETISDRARLAAQEALGRPGVQLEARRQWPPAVASLGVPLAGRIPLTEQAAEGRAVARFSDLGFGTAVRTVCTGPDAPLSDHLARAAVEVLGAWPWDQRPTHIVSIDSHRRPRLVASLASKLSELGRIPQLEAIPHVAPSSTGRSNSVHRLARVHAGYPLPRSIGEALQASPGACVLLVDDFVDTGWTVTVVARSLRLAGAATVLPFTLGMVA